MAIQFNCPSCQAMIRVPDAAAGKKGTCPRCNEKLMVPDVAPPAPPAVASPAPVSAPASENMGLPQLDFGSSAPQPKATAPSDSPFGAVAQQAPATSNSPFGLAPLESSPTYASTRSRKPTKGKGRPSLAAYLVPVVCFAGIVAFIAWYVWSQQPKLEGELVAEVVHDLEVPPATIPGDLSGLKDEDRAEVSRHLRAQPVTWASPSSKFTFTGTDDGFEVSVNNGQTAHFVSVSPSQNAAFRSYVAQHSSELEGPRLATLEKNAPAMYAAWKKQFDKHDQITDQVKFRDQVALPALVGGLGYHVQAVVNNNIYHCVYEDEDGVLYFLLPNATKSFLLEGRDLPGGVRVPAKFTVKITGSTTASAEARPKKTKPKTQAEREAENEGMSSELEKTELEATSASEEMPDSKGSPVREDEMLLEDSMDEGMKKPKASSRKKPAMMEDSEEMSDEMPAKAMPKKKAVKKTAE